MRRVLHLKITVKPDGKVEVVSPELESGQTVDVVVLHESGGRGEGVSGGREGVVGPLTLPLAGLIYIDAAVSFQCERVSRTARFWNRSGRKRKGDSYKNDNYTGPPTGQSNCR